MPWQKAVGLINQIFSVLVNAVKVKFSQKLIQKSFQCICTLNAEIQMAGCIIPSQECSVSLFVY